MTRDEAIKKFAEKRPSYMTDSAKWIDLCVALGMLKLDEPKSAWEKFNEIAANWINEERLGEFFTDIESAGLKIVEK